MLERGMALAEPTLVMGAQEEHLVAMEEEVRVIVVVVGLPEVVADIVVVQGVMSALLVVAAAHITLAQIKTTARVFGTAPD